MIKISLLIIILVTALPSLFKILPENCNNRISAIILLFSAILTFNSLSIKSIGSGIAIYSGLFHITIVWQFMDIVLFTIASFILVSWPLIKYNKNANYLFAYEEENYEKYFELCSQGYNNSFNSSDINKKYIIYNFFGDTENNSDSDLDDELYPTSTNNDKNSNSNSNSNRNFTSSSDVKELESERKIKNEFATKKELNSENLDSNFKNIQSKEPEQDFIPGLGLNTSQDLEDKKISFSQSKSKLVWDPEQEVGVKDVSYHIDPEALSNANKNKNISYDESTDQSMKTESKNNKKVIISANDETVTFLKNSPPSAL
jgi:hypothetical protein